MVPRSLTLGPYSYVESFPATSISPFPLRFVSGSLFSADPFHQSCSVWMGKGKQTLISHFLLSFYGSIKEFGGRAGGGAGNTILTFFHLVASSYLEKQN